MEREQEQDQHKAAAITALKSHGAPFVTIAELCAYLTVNRKTVYKWIDAGVLPAYQFAGQWRIKTSDAVTFEHGARFTPNPSSD